LAAADKLDPEIKELSSFVAAAFDLMKVIIHYSKILAKPE